MRLETILGGTWEGKSTTKTLKDTSRDQSPCENKNTLRGDFKILKIQKLIGKNVGEVMWIWGSPPMADAGKDRTEQGADHIHKDGH